MRIHNHNQRGQALLMVSLSAFAIFGILGLAVDFGWSYFVRKSAQAAADSAALAAAKKGWATTRGPYTCGSGVDCTPNEAPVGCASISSGNLYSGCLYARDNGFTDGGDNGRQEVQLAAGTSSPFQTSSGPVIVQYWVKARVTQRIPQLFSAILGNTQGTVSAVATAGMADMIADGSLYLLNRESDRTIFGNTEYYGTDLMVQANDNGGTYALQTKGGIVMSSSCNGASSGQGNCTAGSKPGYAGMNLGGGTVSAPGTAIKTGGGVYLSGSASWIATPANSSGPFDDPLSGRGQPAAPAGLPNFPVAGCALTGGTAASPVVLHPGNYYSVPFPDGQGSCQLGDPIGFNGYFKFTATSGDSGAICSGGACFGNYVIFGGIKGASGTQITLDTGKFLLAGVKANGNGPGISLDTSTNFTLQDSTSGTGPNTDAGEILIVTDANYPGLVVPADLASVQSQLQMGNVHIQAGNTTSVSLHGLNVNSDLVHQAGLAKFAPGVLWQDQRNSSIQYDANGNIVTSCPGGSMEFACQNTALADPHSPELVFQASPQVHLYGLVYQPRGAWTSMLGGGGFTSPLMLITGAFRLQGNAHLDLQGLQTPLRIMRPALIE